MFSVGVESMRRREGSRVSCVELLLGVYVVSLWEGSFFVSCTGFPSFPLELQVNR